MKRGASPRGIHFGALILPAPGYGGKKSGRFGFCVEDMLGSGAARYKNRCENLLTLSTVSLRSFGSAPHL